MSSTGEKNKVEDLLKVRYLVIADYPNSPFQLQQVLEMKCVQVKYWMYEWAEYDGMDRMYDYEMKAFPHLFRKLEWWEKREIEEMPEYLKIKLANGYVYFNYNPSDYLKDTWMKWKHGAHTLNDFEPATESEYTTSLKSK